MGAKIEGTATVVKNAGSHFLLSELPLWKPFPALLKGKVRLRDSESTNPVAVGDKVRYSYDQDPTVENPASIIEVLDRKNYLVRRSTNLSRQTHVVAANIDMAYVVVSLFFPEIKLPFLDRILVTCEVYGIPATIVLNKTDLYAREVPEAMEHFMEIYRGAGYEVIPTSCKEGTGTNLVRERCKDKINLFCGESGVGKSSLIKAIDPNLSPKIGKISTAHLQGRHTTSLYEMYEISTGGCIIDSPGLRGFGLVDLRKEEIATYFPEMLKVTDNCRFTPCTHTHEPGCAVKAALEAGTISPERYSSYLGMLEDDRKFR